MSLREVGSHLVLLGILVQLLHGLSSHACKDPSQKLPIEFLSSKEAWHGYFDGFAMIVSIRWEGCPQSSLGLYPGLNLSGKKR